MKVRGLEAGTALLEALRGFQVGSPVSRDQHQLTGTLLLELPLQGLDVSGGLTKYGSTSAPQGAILGENVRQELVLPCSALCTHWLHPWLPGVSEWSVRMFVSCCVCMWGTVPENSINGQCYRV